MSRTYVANVLEERVPRNHALSVLMKTEAVCEHQLYVGGASHNWLEAVNEFRRDFELAVRMFFSSVQR
jgi:hypothetical protein